MASKKPKSRFQAALVTGERLSCAFCRRNIDDELTYGKLYAIGDIQVHYFCVLLSCCLVQKGKDSEGLFGFLYTDIIAEVERSKKHKCSYCGSEGATLGCAVSQCRKQFHLPCGREKNAVSLFYGTYKSFCQIHVPKQKIPDHIMEAAKLRRRQANIALRAPTSLARCKELRDGNMAADAQPRGNETESVCVICYEAVDGFPTVNTFWPPCCARDAWFHRMCLQRMALSAGMHYLKCPLCNDKEQFYDAVVEQGYYVPDRDAAWELEQNAFAEIYERPSACSAAVCHCPNGRSHDADTGEWDIKLCILCGTSGCHAACLTGEDCPTLRDKQEGKRIGEGDVVCDTKEDSNESVQPIRYVCSVCKNCAPEDLDSLASRIEAVILSEQARSRTHAARPVMPCRMSLRRTKARAERALPSTSQQPLRKAEPALTENYTHTQEQTPSTEIARLELNLKTPRKPSTQPLVLQTIENTLLSPAKAIEESLSKQIQCMGVGGDVQKEMISKVKEKLKRPGPLCVKRRVANSLLEKFFDDILKGTPLTKCSPKKAKTEITKKTEQKTSAQITPGKLPKSRDNTPEKLSKGGNNTPVKLPKGSNNTPDKLRKGSNNLCEELPEGKINNKNLHHTEVDGDTHLNEIVTDDESSTSTFQLPSEFIADQNSDDSLTLFETPKKRKTVDIQKYSSLEISEKDEVVKVDVVSMKENDSTEFMKALNLVRKTQKCTLKFNPKDKETLVEDEMKIDMECFTSQYLNEVGSFQCCFNHKHSNKEKEFTPRLRTAIDFAYDAYKKNKTDDEKQKQLKRKLNNEDDGPKKKTKNSNNDENQNPAKNKLKDENEERTKPKRTKPETRNTAKKQKILKRKINDINSTRPKNRHVVGKHNKFKIKLKNKGVLKKKNVVKKQKQLKQKLKNKVEVTKKKRKNGEDIKLELMCSNDNKGTSDVLDLTLETSSTPKANKKNNNTFKKNKANNNANISVKIRLKRSQLKLKITQSKIKQQKLKKKMMTQYVLNVGDNTLVNDADSLKLIAKPEHQVTPPRRKYIKQEKTPDSLVQTSIQSFFKRLSSEPKVKEE